jgi:hypothetical protein
MRGVSSIVVVVLLLLLGITLTSSVFVFFGDVILDTKDSLEDTRDHVSTSLLAEMRLEPLSESNIVSVKNTGKVNISDFNVYVNGDFVITSVSTIIPGDVTDIDIGSSLISGDTVKVTSAEGATAFSTVP